MAKKQKNLPTPPHLKKFFPIFGLTLHFPKQNNPEKLYSDSGVFIALVAQKTSGCFNTLMM